MPKSLKANKPIEAEAESVSSSLRIVCDDAATIQLAAAEVAIEGEDKPRLAKFSMTAYTGGAMRLGGWPYPVVVDLAGMRVDSGKSRPRSSRIMTAAHRRPHRRHHDHRPARPGGRRRDQRRWHNRAGSIPTSEYGFPWQARLAVRVPTRSSSSPKARPHKPTVANKKARSTSPASQHSAKSPSSLLVPTTTRKPEWPPATTPTSKTPATKPTTPNPKPPTTSNPSTQV